MHHALTNDNENVVPTTNLSPKLKSACDYFFMRVNDCLPAFISSSYCFITQSTVGVRQIVSSELHVGIGCDRGLLTIETKM